MMGRAVSASAESKSDLSDKDDVVTWKLNMTPKTESHFNQLARDIGGTREDVLKRALVLLTIAVGAKQEGKGIAIVDEDGNIDTEITGF
jgi:hypothetical protein